MQQHNESEKNASLLDYENRVDRQLAIHDAKQRLRDAQLAKRPLTITAPLPGWRRFENIHDGRTIDFNPKDPVHQVLLKVYEARTDWREIAPPSPADVDSTGGVE